MNLYSLTHHPELGRFTSATAAIVAEILAGLNGSDLDWTVTI